MVCVKGLCAGRDDVAKLTVGWTDFCKTGKRIKPFFLVASFRKVKRSILTPTKAVSVLQYESRQGFEQLIDVELR